MSSSLQIAYVVTTLFTCVSCKVWNVLDHGVIESDPSLPTCNANTKIVNRLLNELLQPGDTLLIPHSYHFWFNGGIFASSMQSITIQIDGAIHYQHNREDWPTVDDSHKVVEAMKFVNSNDIRLTSSHQTQKGLIHGHGHHWWGAAKYCQHKENRPRLLHIYNSTDLVLEHLFLKDSPYWNVYLEDVKNVEIHHTNISAKMDADKDDHDLFELTAFNTDGFDVSGENIWIHDVDIWNNDDCIAVKAQSGLSYQSNCSRNMVFERITASGLGLTIGSIGSSVNHSCVNNITFRDAYLYKTWKGIYMKSAPHHHNDSGDIVSGQISNILYENIVMDQPSNVPIWIGPQQAVYHDQCSLLWPYDPWARCPVTPYVSWSNITLRNITINSPRHSPGLLLGSTINPMINITFDKVVVNNPGMTPWGVDYYKCQGVEQFEAKDGTEPIPLCGPHSVMDLQGVELSKTWQQKLEDVPGLDKYLGLVMCLKHKAAQEDLAASKEEQNPSSFQGQQDSMYEDIDFHVDPKKQMQMLTVEESLTVMGSGLLFTFLTACIGYLVIVVDDF